jgi:hypothetical protein
VTPGFSQPLAQGQRLVMMVVNPGIVVEMHKLHGDRDNPRTLWHSTRTAAAKHSTEMLSR